MSEDKKIGLYICSGCEIGSTVDIEALEKTATDTNQAEIVKTHPILCNPEGVDIIKKDIEENGLNAVSVCACSGRVMTDVFSFGKNVFLDRANIREFVAWTQKASDDEDAQIAAEDYVKMSLAKLASGAVPEPHIEEEISKIILVVGGGKTGMESALNAADAGMDVVLVEKEEKLGGMLGKYKKSFPKKPPYTDLEDTGIEDLINLVNSHDKIKVLLKTEVGKVSGQPGQFKVELKNGSAEEFTAGAIVLASGWRPYDAGKLSHLGAGKANVVTNVQLEEMAANGGIKRPGDGKEISSIAFIQCAGSRDPDHLPYCSAVCCRASLKQAMYVREQYPDAKIYIIYKDIRTPAQFELFYAKVQEEDNIFMTKGEVVNVDENSGGGLTIDVDETLIGDKIQVNADMVVLATGMVPSTKVDDDNGEAVSVEGEALPEAETPAETEKAEDDEKGKAAGAEAGAGILNLEYRQGTDLPTLKYGFPDSHFICFPYETRRTAIYAAGCVRAPMDTLNAESDAAGAALKAIQALHGVETGQAVHPRAGDISFPDFYLSRCTQCKRCTEECPFGMLEEDEKGTPKPNITRCRRCGICMGACPERIITFADYNINMTNQMIKVISMPDEFDEKPRILVFMCENDAIPAFDIVSAKRPEITPWIRIIPVRCLGSINVIWINDAVSSGFDGILLLGCKFGDDYQCHFIRGSELATTRMENVAEKLQQLVLEPERVKIETIAMNEYDKIPQILNDFAEEIEEIGANPYKDM
ncbi:hydrogenase iron-sulfur subunit [candidate division KSB1 bacterium]